MAEYTVTRDNGVITIHEGDHHSPPIATFEVGEGYELFDVLVAAATATGTHTFWHANEARYL